MRTAGRQCRLLLALLILLLGACSSAGAGPQKTPAPRPVAIDKALVVDGEHVLLHYRPGASAEPLVLALHGIGSSGVAFSKYSKLSGYADGHGFVVAYPDGHESPHVPDASVTGKSAGGYGPGRAWNAGTCCGDSTADDVSFLLNVVKAVERESAIDKNRVYVVGLSNGGMMALRAICDAPTVFAAAGSVAGPFLESSCGRAVWEHLHGAADRVVPLHGGESPGVSYLGVPENWCQCSFPDSTTEAARFPGQDVIVKQFPHAGHTWPTIGDHTWNIDANSELWRFLSNHELNGPIGGS